MKICFGMLTLFLLPFSYLSAQIQDTIYLDKNWEVSTHQKASYYRFINKEKSKGYHVKDYHLDGQLQMEGTYKDKKLKKKEGKFTWYFKNGNVDRKGAFLKNRKTGPWKWYFREGSISAEENYIKGERTDANFFDINGHPVSQKEAEDNLDRPERSEALSSYLETHGKYPEKARAKNIKGTVMVRVLVDESGIVEKTKFLNHEHPYLKTEAISLIESIPPELLISKEHGRPLKYWINIPVRFRLKWF